MAKVLSCISQALWGAPVLLLILGVGLYLSIRLGFPQLRFLPEAGVRFFRFFLPGHGENGSFRSLCTALGATVGTGNLIGVAGAICLGGPGAVFWMWVGGLLGMATKYAEATLAVRYRIRSGGDCLGGPMYMITEGLGRRFLPLARVYCLLGLLASFGVGNAAQINGVITGFRDVAAAFGKTPDWKSDLLLGVLLSLVLGKLLFGGDGSIGRAAQTLVPLAAAGYVLLCAGVLASAPGKIPWAFGQIFSGVWDPRAVTGGMLGSAFGALRIGCSRGVFTNEAGMGTAAIAHGQAQVFHPAQQGLMGIMEVFLDTILMCTLTALVILVSGVPVPYGCDEGARLVLEAFAVRYGSFARIALTGMLSLFAVATVLGWGLYGGRCAGFLFGQKAWKYYAGAQTLGVILSSLGDTALIWQLSEIFNGLMAIPNLITLAVLSPELCRLTKEYRKIRPEQAGGGTYADFHQRKPL